MLRFYGSEVKFVKLAGLSTFVAQIFALRKVLWQKIAPLALFCSGLKQ
jgi:hypothetical protein